MPDCRIVQCGGGLAGRSGSSAAGPNQGSTEPGGSHVAGEVGLQPKTGRQRAHGPQNTGRLSCWEH